MVSDTLNPYAAPESDVEYSYETVVLNGSVFWGSGRLSVLSFFAHYVLLTCLNGAVSFALSVIAGSSTQPFDARSIFSSSYPVLVLVPYAVSTMLFSWVYVCQTIKRLHDLNLSGWWILLAFLPLGVIGVSSYFGYNGGPWAVALAGVIVSVFLLMPGKDKPNRFGGWRETRFWEKVVLLGVLVIVLVVILLFIVLVTLPRLF